MRHILAPAFLLMLCLLTMGCGDDPIGPIGPSDIPFDLTIPFTRPAADYYAVSGVQIDTRSVRIGDSIAELAVPAFYAQFHSPKGEPLPGSVLLNRNPLERHLGGDTLRLASAASSNVFGDNTWILADTDDTVSVLAPKVDIVDSLEPFSFKTTFRNDTGIVIKWKRPVFGASGLILRWESRDYIHMVPLVDALGFAEIDAATMDKLRGKGTITLLRYLTLEKQYRGKKLVVTRVAQRSYDVTVN